MIGNAVPVEMAKVLGEKIVEDLSNTKTTKKEVIQKEAVVNNGNIVREKMNEIINSISA